METHEVIKKLMTAAAAVASAAAAHASTIQLKATTIDPSATPRRLLGAATCVDVPTRGLYLVQPVNGEITDEWRDRLVALGAKVRSYIPDDTYLVEIPGDRYADLAANLPHSYLGEFKPEYRYDAAELPSGASAAPGRKSRSLLADSPESEESEEACAELFDILLFEDGAADSVARKISALNGCTVKEASGCAVRAALTAAAVREVASWPDVHWIERFDESAPDLDMALKAERADVESVWEGGATLLGLTGKNQIIGVTDGGLDTGTNSTLHLDIRGRIVSATSVSGRGKWHDQSGHGTHVVGCAMGDGRRSGGGIRGPAYEARLVFQSTLEDDTSDSDINIPSDLEGMFRSAYNLGARVHNNSYGKGKKGDPKNAYINVCRQVDNFVFTHPDMTIVWSAGNNGVDISPTNGVIDASTLNGYAAAKNSIVVGASENLQTGNYSGYSYGSRKNTPVSPIYGDAYSMPYDGVHQGLAAFSSRGPTTDGRIRPDIVAPGTGIVAMQSSIVKKATGFHEYDDYYCYKQGTSMAAPIVAGSAALVRQWMAEQYGVESPDAATVKAILIAGAKSLSPGQYGTGAFREIPSAYPNNAEGWGQMSLSNSLANLSGVYVKNANVIGNDESRTFLVQAPKGRPVTFVLAWTDAPGDPSASDTGNKRVNALKFAVTRDDGTKYTVNPGGSTGATVLGVRIPASEMASSHVFTARVWTVSNSIKTGMSTTLTGGKSNATRYSLVVNGGRAAREYWDVLFHYNYGSYTVKTNFANVGAVIHDFMPKPTRSGYTFDGWYTSATGGREVSPFTIVNNETIHLYAHWRKNPPSNDNFANAIFISGYKGQASGTTFCATKETGDPLPSYRSVATNTVWWTWTAPATGDVQFNTCESDIYDTVMGVYTGSSVSALTKVAENDDIGDGVRASSNRFSVVSGRSYRICVAGYGNDNVGIVRLNWSYLTKAKLTFDANGGQPPSSVRYCELGEMIGPIPTATFSNYIFDGWWSANGERLYSTTVIYGSATYTANWISRPENDNFARARSISGMAGSVSGYTTYASEQSGEPLKKFRSVATNTVWWVWTAPAGGNAVFSTTNSVFDTVMGIYTGSSLSALTTIAENDDGGPGRTSICRFSAVAGTKYYVVVSGYGSDQGKVNLEWSLVPDIPTYTVTLGKNGGTGGDNYVTATYGAAMPTPRTAPTLSGWTFAGYWDSVALDEKGTPKGKQYYDASMKSVRNWDKKSATTLWAKWTNKVTLGKNGGTGGDNYVTCTKGQPMPKRTMPTKSGYVFDGYWNTVKDGGVKYYNADGTSAHAWDKGGSVTLWAKWVKPVACKVTFGKNGGTGGDNYVTCTTGKPMPTPRTAPKLSGWTFGGYWDTLACDEKGNPKGKQYYNSKMESVRAWDKTTATTLWAKWTVKVTLGKNGGTGGDSVVTVTKGQSFPKRTMPTRSGYKFGGYFVSASKKTGQCYNTDGTGTASMKWSTGGTPTIWALWTKTSTCVELSPTVARRAASAAPETAPQSAVSAGIYSGALADGTGAFLLMLDELEEDAPRTAFLYIASEDGSLTTECEVTEAGGILLLTTEDGNMYWFDIAGGALGDRALPSEGE